MKRQAPATQTIPVPFKVFCPVAEVMNFIEQQNRRSVLSLCFGLSPTPFPVAGKRGIRLVSRGVDSGVAELRTKVKQQGGFTNLSGPCQ
jgi:hypothetical protein